MSSGRMWHRWNASDMSHLLKKTGPSFESASHIRWRSRGRHEPNCIAEGLVDVSVVSLTDFVDASGASEELHIRRGLRLAWSRQARRKIFSRLPKHCKACSTDRMILKPLCERSRSSSLQKAVAVADIAEVCGPFSIPTLMEAMGQGGPASAGHPSEA